MTKLAPGKPVPAHATRRSRPSDVGRVVEQPQEGRVHRARHVLNFTYELVVADPPSSCHGLGPPGRRVVDREEAR